MATSSHFVIDAGSLFEAVATIENEDKTIFNLTNMTVKAQMRRSYYSNSFIEFEATVLGDPVNGSISLKLPASISKVIKHGRYVYDVVVKSTVDTNYVKRVLEGLVTVYPNVTRE